MFTSCEVPSPQVSARPSDFHVTRGHGRGDKRHLLRLGYRGLWLSSYWLFFLWSFSQTHSNGEDLLGRNRPRVSKWPNPSVHHHEKQLNPTDNKMRHLRRWSSASPALRRWWPLLTPLLPWCERSGSMLRLQPLKRPWAEDPASEAGLRSFTEGKSRITSACWWVLLCPCLRFYI